MIISLSQIGLLNIYVARVAPNELINLSILKRSTLLHIRFTSENDKCLDFKIFLVRPSVHFLKFNFHTNETVRS